MSRASKITLAATSLFALSTVGIVHFQQKAERSAMHEGVIRDMEQIRQKKERQLDFDLQRAMEAEYLKNQTVKSTTNDGDGGAPEPAPAPAVAGGGGAGGSGGSEGGSGGSEGTKA